MWAVVFLAAYNTLATIPANAGNLVYINGAINIVGMILATYFHVNPSQQYSDNHMPKP